MAGLAVGLSQDKRNRRSCYYQHCSFTHATLVSGCRARASLLAFFVVVLALLSESSASGGHQQQLQQQTVTTTASIMADKDIFSGTYRLIKSDNFDQFLYEMGIGMIKRKVS